MTLFKKIENIQKFMSFIVQKVALYGVVSTPLHILSLLIKITRNDSRIYQINFFQNTI